MSVTEDAPLVTEDMSPEQLREALNKAHADLKQNVRDLKARGESVEKLKDEIAEVRATSNKLSQALAQRSAPDLTDGERGLKRFVTSDGKVRAVGNYYEKTGKADEEFVPGLFDSDVTHGEWHRDAQVALEDYCLVRDATRDLRTGAIDRRKTRMLRDRVTDALARAPIPAIRAWGESDAGSEFIDNAQVLPELQRASAVTAVGGIFDLFPQVNMTRKTLEMPYQSGLPTPYIYGQQTDNPAKFTRSDVGTDERTLTAKSLAWAIVVDNDAAEDSYVDALPMLRQAILDGRAYAWDDAVINGDTAATHQDDLANWNPYSLLAAGGLGSTADHRRVWIGLRARALDIGATAAVDQSAAQTYAGAMALRKGMGVGMRSGMGGAVFLVSEEYYYGTLITLEQVATVDKYGANAAVLSGEVARLGGVPVIPTPMLTGDLNNSGVFDNSTTDKTGMLCVNTNRFVRGMRRGLRFAVQAEEIAGVRYLVASERAAFQSVDPGTTVNVRYGYKLTA